MRIHALMALAVGLLIAADIKNDGAKKELKKLSGSYVIVSGESRAEKLSEGEDQGSQDDYRRSEVHSLIRRRLGHGQAQGGLK